MEAHETGFGGGCHWCTEAVFQSLRGIVRVRQGFIAADPPYDGFSEAVAVAWDPVRISLEDPPADLMRIGASAVAIVHDDGC